MPSCFTKTVKIKGLKAFLSSLRGSGLNNFGLNMDYSNSRMFAEAPDIFLRHNSQFVHQKIIVTFENRVFVYAPLLIRCFASPRKVSKAIVLGVCFTAGRMRPQFSE